MSRLSIIIPACNEAAHIGSCLDSLLLQRLPPTLDRREIIVVANGCRDATAAIARTRLQTALEKGWLLRVINRIEAGKPEALNAGDRVAKGDLRVYMDADVLLDAGFLAEICQVLATQDPVFASGRPLILSGESWTTRRYADLWSRLPFLRRDVPGTGLYAVNAAGRARWGEFPGVIADDTFARLHFSPQERQGVRGRIYWALPEGWYRLFRVRRRQDTGVAEIRRRFPELLVNEGPSPPRWLDLVRLAAAVPMGFLVYCSVALAVRLAGPANAWDRGR